jgi:hypothetical protein
MLIPTTKVTKIATLPRFIKSHTTEKIAAGAQSGAKLLNSHDLICQKRVVSRDIGGSVNRKI